MKKVEVEDNSKRKWIDNKGDESIVNLIPFKSCSKDGFVKKSDNSYQVYLNIRTTDLQSLNEDELARWADSWTRINQIYGSSLKLITMARKTRVPRPLGYWKYNNSVATRELARNKNIEANHVINQITISTLNKLRNMERNNTDLKFYFMVSDKTMSGLVQKIRILRSVGEMQFGLEILDKSEVTAVLKRMFNMNDEGA